MTAATIHEVSISVDSQKCNANLTAANRPGRQSRARPPKVRATMQTVAVVMDGPGQAALQSVTLTEPGPEDVVVDIQWSSISARDRASSLVRPHARRFPAWGIRWCRATSRSAASSTPATGLWLQRRRIRLRPRCPLLHRGARPVRRRAAARLVVPGARVSAIDADLGERGALLSLAATGLSCAGRCEPAGADRRSWRARPRCWPASRSPSDMPRRRSGRARNAAGVGASVIAEADDDRRDYGTIYDASGDAAILDRLIARLRRGGEVSACRLLSRAHQLHFSPCFHAGGAVSHRGPNSGPPTSRPSRR